MTTSRTAKKRRAFTLGAALPLLLAIGALPASATSHEPTTRLGTADDFAILAGSTITNTGRSVITGDVGLHPGTAVTGFESCTGPANCVDLTGTMHVTDADAQQAKADLLTAYNTLVGLEGTCTPLVVELGGATLTPGVYCSPTFGLTGELTLSGIGEFIFLTGAGGSTLTTAAASQVLLTNGADSCSVYWQVASSATIGAGSAFAGNILADTSISFGTDATLEGSALALDAAVTLISNTITDSTCAAGGTPPDDDGTPSNDDGNPPDDDGTPPDDDGTPPDDDGTPPDDDGTPPDDDGTPGGDVDSTPPNDDGTPSNDDGNPPDDDGTPSGDLDSTPPDEDGLPALGVLSLTASRGQLADGRRDRDESESGQNLPATGSPIQLHFLLALLSLILGAWMVQMSSRPAPARARSHLSPSAGRETRRGFSSWETPKKETSMRGTTDKVTGRIKQAIGALIGNEKMKRHGRADERAGRIKRQSDDPIDVVLDRLEDVAGTLHSGQTER